MTERLTLAFGDAESVRDLDTFVDRAGAIENEAVRLKAEGDILTAWVQVLSPRGLSDTTPTVLGMRGFALAIPAQLDVVVPIESLRARLSAAATVDGNVIVTLPATVPSIRWTVTLPPRDGWEITGKVNASDLEKVTRDGVKEIQKNIPTEAEERVVRSVRSQIWGANISKKIGLPAGVAFAAVTLGFLGDKTLPVSIRDPWIRVSSGAGDVVAKRTEVVLDDDPLEQ
ncbi:MAG: hypothetical protein RLZ72_111 [Actinomycetota bacterium]|jgi:hypothetical protein